MCGRYTLVTPAKKLAEEFSLDASSVDLPPNYNVAPTQGVAAVLSEGGERRLEILRWGLIPPWADDPQIGSRMINARAETAPEKPSFRRAFRERRCLIPADGFYEWKRTNGSKQPYYIHMKDERPFTFAGLWESWNDNSGPAIRSCTILTAGPNALVAGVPDRIAGYPPRRLLRRVAGPGSRAGRARRPACAVSGGRDGGLPGEPLRQQPLEQRSALHRARSIRLSARQP